MPTNKEASENCQTDQFPNHFLRVHLINEFVYKFTSSSRNAKVTLSSQGNLTKPILGVRSKVILYSHGVIVPRGSIKLLEPFRSIVVK